MKLLSRPTVLRTCLPRQPRASLQRTAAFSHAGPLRLKEDKDRDGQELEKEKQESIKKGEWNKELASSSEEVVGAEQEKVKDHDKHMDKLQKETAQKGEKDHGKS